MNLLNFKVLKRLGEKKTMKKLILPFFHEKIVPMLRPPTVVELLKKVYDRLMEMTEERRAVEVPEFGSIVQSITKTE